MRLTLELNDQQEAALRKMFETGLYGADTAETAVRLLDQAFIDYLAMRPDSADEREAWQREEGGE
jgi:hypothetical protein